MTNPNPYDDEGYAKLSSMANNAICGLWEAGASLRDIEEVVSSALDNAEMKVDVEITALS